MKSAIVEGAISRIRRRLCVSPVEDEEFVPEELT